MGSIDWGWFLRREYREAHSTDGRSYIERTNFGWGVWWDGTRVPGTFKTREAARCDIRARKKTNLKAG